MGGKVNKMNKNVCDFHDTNRRGELKQIMSAS